MGARAFSCGESLCKKAFEVEIGDPPWPVRCPGCRRSLYPEDILASSALESLDPHRGPLMTAHAGKLLPVRSSDLATRRGTAKPSILDEIAEATVTAQAPPKPARTGLWVALAAAVAAIVAWIVLRS